MPKYNEYLGSSEWVKLTDTEIDEAIRHGLRMRKYSKTHSHTDHRTKLSKPYDEKLARRIQALGAVGEAGVRKYLGLPLALESEIYGEADLPYLIEVKVIGRPWYGLRIYPRTPDNRRVVGIVIPPGKERERYRIAGWIWARDAKKEEDWKIAPHGGPPMWAVPQSELRPAKELLEVVRKEGKV